MAQDYEPTVSWPYELREFTHGEVMTFKGDLYQSSEFNVCITDGKLHFIDDSGTIMAADMGQVGSARIGSAIYVNWGGRMYRALASGDSCYVLQLTQVDESAASRSDIGYGISSQTASSQNVSTLLGSGTSMLNMNLMSARERRGEGVAIPTRTRLYLMLPGKLIPADKRSVLDAVDESHRKEVADYIKAGKIKWKKPESLISLATYLAGLK